MVTLRVVIDQIVSPNPGGIGRYAEELTRQLIERAPKDTDVAGITSRLSDDERARVTTLLPGLTSLHESRLARRELSLAWQAGLAMPGGGMVHAMSLLAPLRKHDRVNAPGHQTVVTVHDATPWIQPETLSPRNVRWFTAMAKRAERFADAVVVPSHTVAGQLAERFSFGGRIRVIGGAVSAKLTLPVDPDARAARLGLPERYVFAVGTLDPRKGLEALIRSLAHPDAADLPLVISGPDGWNDIDVKTFARDAGVADGRVITLGHLADADLAVAYSRASVFVFPNLTAGFGLPVIEAFSLGTPVVHSDAPAAVEVAAGAGLAVERDDAAGYPERLAQAISTVVNDGALAEQLRFSGLDRAGGFSWADSADRIWQLHADL
ncbi:MAG: glycosyltransferase family 4 protein [Cryobacterium sp.]|nr:glycosyltransferase family 4 protein [Cryobacterium sp.]